MNPEPSEEWWVAAVTLAILQTLADDLAEARYYGSYRSLMRARDRVICEGCGCLCLPDEVCPGCRARRLASSAA